MSVPGGPGSWKIDKAIPTMAVPNLEAGIEFYERLGFEVDWRWPAPSPTHSGLMRGSCSIMLALCDPYVCADVYFIVDDVKACHTAIVEAQPWQLAAKADDPPARSLQAPSEPKETAYGLRDFSLIDPWGHSLSFGEVVPEGG